MSDFLRKFTDAVGAELEVADRDIASVCRKWGKVGGLLTCARECNYQYIAWRPALSLCYAEMEKYERGERQDLVLLAPPHAARIEMKTWLSENGYRELYGIRSDIEKLQKCAVADAAFVLFSSNDRGHLGEQLKFLRKEVFDAMPPSIWGEEGPRIYCFPTASPWQSEAEFWVAVWPIKIGPLFSGPG